jgi:cbb3-type cytochrome oxidase subunit 3
MAHEPNIAAILCFDVAFLLGYVYWALWQLEKMDRDDDQG